MYALPRMSLTVACEACGARLTIPDSLFEKKIKGKTVNISCKKCGKGIRVDGTKPQDSADDAGAKPSGSTPKPADVGGGSAAEGLWAVAFAEDDDRELTTQKVAEALKRGDISGGNLVWRDGMSDWKPLEKVPELAAHIPSKLAGAPGGSKVTLADAPVPKAIATTPEPKTAEPKTPEPTAAAPKPPSPPSPPTPPSPPKKEKAEPEPTAEAEKSGSGQSDVVSSVAPVDFAALAAPAPKEEKPAEEAKPPPSPFGEVSAPPIQAPPVETAPSPKALEDASADYTGAGDADMFVQSDRKKYVPLAVIGVVLLIGIIVLSAGGSSEPTRPAERQQAKPAEKGPPRDIRAQMEKKKDDAAEQGKGSAASPASGSKDQAEKTGVSSGSGSDEADLVEAMKQGLEK